MKRGPYCIICEDVRTNHPSGICSRCRRSYERGRKHGDYTDGDIMGKRSCRVATAIARESLILDTLLLRHEGKTFDEISTILQRPKTSLFDNFCVAMATYFAGDNNDTYDKWKKTQDKKQSKMKNQDKEKVKVK